MSVAQPRTTVVGALVLAAVIAGTLVGGVLGLGLAFLIATAARMLDGKGWWVAADRDARGTVMLLGALAGAAALVAALALSTPLADSLSRGVEWSTAPVVRGSIVQTATIAVLLVAISGAAELTFRRWLLDWVADGLAGQGTGRKLATAVGVAAAALVEAAIVPVDGDRVGIAITSVGLGLIYVAAGRRVGASISARVVFEVGALLLQALRLVG